MRKLMITMSQFTKVFNNIIFCKLKHVSRFAVVGIINTAIDFLMFTLSQSVFGLGYSISQIIGYSFGVSNSFVLNKIWTFDDKSVNKKTYYELIQFIIVNLFSLSITIIAMKALIINFHTGVYVSKILVTILTQITNYLGYKLWVFSEK
jgi:putative flippase GtrA